MIYRVLILSLVYISVSGVLLGANKCTRGPAHWCSSINNAKACGMGSMKYCRDKVWIGNHPLAQMTNPIPEDIDDEDVADDDEFYAEEAEPLIRRKDLSEQQKAEKMAKAIDPYVGQYTEHKLGGNCALCELVVKELVSKLKDNATEEQLIEDMDKLCDLVPGHLSDSCRQFVDEYGKEFWEAFIANVDTRQICSYIGLCSQEFLSIVKQNNVMANFLAKNVEGIGCDTCTAVMGLVQKEVLANEKMIESLLDQTCTILPIDQQTCDDTVNGMFEALVNLFESYKPDELCQMLGLCQSMMDTLIGLGPVQMGQVGQTGPAAPNAILGKDNSCQNGPSYWCASPENARECKMEEYCKRESPIVF